MTPKQTKEFKEMKAVMDTVIEQLQITMERAEKLEAGLGRANRRIRQVRGALLRIPRIPSAGWHDLSDYATPKVEFLDDNFDKLKAWADTVSEAIETLTAKVGEADV